MTAIHGKMEWHTRNRWKLNFKRYSESKTLFLSGERGDCLLHMFLVSCPGNSQCECLRLPVEPSAKPTIPWPVKKILIYLAVRGLSCGVWDLVPWPGIKLRPPALGVWEWPLDHQGSPTWPISAMNPGLHYPKTTTMYTPIFFYLLSSLFSLV